MRSGQVVAIDADSINLPELRQLSQVIKSGKLLVKIIESADWW